MGQSRTSLPDTYTHIFLINQIFPSQNGSRTQIFRWWKLENEWHQKRYLCHRQFSVCGLLRPQYRCCGRCSCLLHGLLRSKASLKCCCCCSELLQSIKGSILGHSERR